MPYVPSKKTDGKSIDREQLDIAVEALAQDLAGKITNNLSLITVYKNVFQTIANQLTLHRNNPNTVFVNDPEVALACTIHSVGAEYPYEGAFLGELNYAITRLIQRVPQIKVQRGEWAQEIRYWLYAATVEALTWAAYNAPTGFGVSGVFEDIKDEYKRRVNTAYEAEQILKSGDCYDTPYYTRLVRVVKEDGTLVGHQEVMLKRSDATLNVDVLFGDVFGEIVLRQPTK